MSVLNGIISGYSRMRGNMNITLVCIGIIFLLVISVSSAGCIKYIQNKSSNENGTQTVSGVPKTQLPPGDILGGNLTNMSGSVTPQPGSIEVDEVDPGPYVTPDLYRLPYRDLGNMTSGGPFRVTRIPQSAKHIVLRSNSTAFSLVAVQAPIVIDFIFSPNFDNPDQTGDTSRSYPPKGKNAGGEVDWANTRILSGSYAFVYPNAEISVIDALTNETVAKEGYAGIYSSEKMKRVTLYRDGSYIVTLAGDYVTADMRISTGSAPVKTTPVPPSPTMSGGEDEEDW